MKENANIRSCGPLEKFIAKNLWFFRDCPLAQRGVLIKGRDFLEGVITENGINRTLSPLGGGFSPTDRGMWRSPPSAAELDCDGDGLI
jgi:hypothetical protein